MQSGVAQDSQSWFH